MVNIKDEVLVRLIDEDFPSLKPVTAEAIERIKREPSSYRGSVRISLGKIWIEKDYEKFRFEVLNTPLP